MPIPRLPPVTIAVFPVSSRSTSALHGAAKRRAHAGWRKSIMAPSVCKSAPVSRLVSNVVLRP